MSDSETTTSTDTTEESGFKPITSQEELDRIVQARVARAKESAAAEERAKFEGYHAPSEFDALKSEREKLSESLNGEYRKAAAREAKLPETFADRLVGNNLDEWKSDANALAQTLLGQVMGEKPVVEETKVDEPAGSPRRTPAEQRGIGGGNPAVEKDLDVDEALAKIPRN